MASSATPAPRSSSSSPPSADSYIGSLISLTSNSEIRYEGLLFNINAQESSIGLSNVRSFGTEGRKKDGPQVPPSDKVYEYILFRGSDIKDLQVKSCAPVQAPTPVFDDPAIIQTHYSQAANPSVSLQPSGIGSIPDLSAHNPQSGLVRPPFQSNPSLYPPVGNVVPWASSPSLPAINGSAVAPMYFPGYYGSTNMFQPQQQTLFRPPPSLSMLSPMQQMTHHSTANLALATGASSMAASDLSKPPSALLPIPNFQSSIVPIQSSSPSTFNFQPSMLPTQPSAVASESSTNLVPNKIPAQPSPLVTSLDKPAIQLPISDNPVTVPSSILPLEASEFSSAAGIPSSTSSEGAMPNLITPGQLLQSGPTTVSTTELRPQTSQKYGESVQVSTSELLSPQVAPEERGPLLQSSSVSSIQSPSQASQKDSESVEVSSSGLFSSQEAPEALGPLLPQPPPVEHKLHAARQYSHPRYNNRGGPQRGRGNRMSRPAARFSEDFDFTAMNEKFNKDEVWGDLGKTASVLEDGNESENEDDVGSSKLGSKPVYVKDDFFDSLSSYSLDHGSENGRLNSSQQRKKDSETFGYLPRHRGGRGGHGHGRGGRQGGGYYGRGNGHVGRGQGHNFPVRGAK